jgi:hypothetical protein
MSKGVQKISINHTGSGEVYDRSTTIANLCFSTVVAKNFLSDPDPKTVTECKNHPD